jgi:pimeloyl-ACP methyl ester carboxylesterase
MYSLQMASTAPSPDDSVGAIMTVLDTDGHDKACIVAHSLGCTVASWLLHHPVACRRVSATVLIDPVTFLLCDPTVATKVVYKDPVNTLDFLMHFFVARELFIANALSRHFNWSHNIIFVEDLSAVDSKDFHAYSPFLNANNPSKGVECDGSDSGGSVDSFDTPVQQLQIRHTVSISYFGVSWFNLLFNVFECNNDICRFCYPRMILLCLSKRL